MASPYGKLEPEAVFPDAETMVAYFPKESWTDAPALTKTLVQAAGNAGALPLFGNAVHGIKVGGDGVTLQLGNGAIVQAEAVTHSGITLGPLVGRLLAREMLTGEVDPLIAPFRPDRFPST